MKTRLSVQIFGRFVGLVMVAIAAVAGCANKDVHKVTVRGTISYEGKALQSGMLNFIGPEGASTSAVIQPDGTFIITDVMPGTVKIGVTDTPKGLKSTAVRVDLPEKFRDPETSGLEYTITPETKELLIEIK